MLIDKGVSLGDWSLLDLNFLCTARGKQISALLFDFFSVVYVDLHPFVALGNSTAWKPEQMSFLFFALTEFF